MPLPPVPRPRVSRRGSRSLAGMFILHLAVGVAVAGIAVFALPTAAWAANVSTAFGFTGAPQTFVMPDGVTHLDLVLDGAKGGNASTLTVGGAGAEVSFGIDVTP